MSDTYVDTHNPIFGRLYELYTRWQHIPTPFLKKAEPTTQNIHNHHTQPE
jgi:hypothetical protein